MKTVSVVQEYAKDKYLKPDDVKNMMSWVERQPHLPKISELEIILFLHSCYYSQEAAKITIDNHYTCRTHCPEFFNDRDPLKPAFQKSMDILVFQPLPQPTDKGHRIIFLKFINPDSPNFSFQDQMKIFIMSMDLWILQDGIAEGHEIIMDISDITLTHLTKLGPVIMKKLFYYLQEAIPFRLKGLHFFNIVPFMDKILMIMKPFLKKELFNVLYMHTPENIKDLYKIVPQKYLPEDYGGNAPSIKTLHTQMKQNIIDHAEYFNEEEKHQRVDEKKRPGKAKTAGDIWGIDGSFKKLDID